MMTERVLGCIIIFLIVLACSFLGGWILMLLWNWLAPLFWASAPILTFWQAWGVSLILSLIGNKFRSTSSK